MHRFANVFRGLVLAQLAACGRATAPTSEGAPAATGAPAEALAIPPAPSATSATVLKSDLLHRRDIPGSDEFWVEVQLDGYSGDSIWAPLLQRYADVSFYQHNSVVTACEAWLPAACKVTVNPTKCDPDVRARVDNPCATGRVIEQVAVKGGVLLAVSKQGRNKEVRDLIKAVVPSFKEWEHAWLAARLYFMHATFQDNDLTMARQKDRWVVTGSSRPTRDMPGPGVTTLKVRLELHDDGTLTDSTTVTRSMNHVVRGRKPAGLGRVESRGASDLGRFFAHAAHMEAASIAAFERFASELTAFGAPRSLVRRARAAANDEARHARRMGVLRRRFGAAELPVHVRKPKPRSFYAFAKENAVGGCILETYAAMEAHYVSNAASDDRVRSAHRPIACDETRHAELAWDVAAWASERLTSAQKKRLATAQQRALRELRLELSTPKAAVLHEVAGVPAPETALRLCEAFFSQQQQLAAAA